MGEKRNAQGTLNEEPEPASKGRHPKSGRCILEEEEKKRRDCFKKLGLEGRIILK
jgi:hypothetical protein